MKCSSKSLHVPPPHAFFPASAIPDLVGIPLVMIPATQLSDPAAAGVATFGVFWLFFLFGLHNFHERIWGERGRWVT